MVVPLKNTNTPKQKENPLTKNFCCSIILILFVTGILLFVLVGAFNSIDEKKDEQVAAQQTKQLTSEIKTEDDLKNRIKSIVELKKWGSMDVKYIDAEIGSGWVERPIGSKQITVKIKVSSIWDKSSLIRNSSDLSSELYKTIFTTKFPITDAYIWYYGDAVDKYGNTSEVQIQLYAMEKDVYSKINWKNFETNSLCELLESEKGLNGNSCTTTKFVPSE